MITFKITLGSLWDHAGVTLGSCWDHVGVTLEPILDKLISPMQWGFLPGRSLLSNVVDIDEGMTTAALCQEEGAALLFDFKAAFPSVLHSFLMEVLRHRSSAAVDALPRRSVHQQHLLVGPWRE